MLNCKYWNTTPSIYGNWPLATGCWQVERKIILLNFSISCQEPKARCQKQTKFAPLLKVQLKYIHRDHRTSLCIGQSIVMVLFDVVAEMHSDGLQFVVLQIWHQLL